MTRPDKTEVFIWEYPETLTFSPGTFFGLMPFMIHTASMTILTPSGGLCIARTSTMSSRFKFFRLTRAASYAQMKTTSIYIRANPCLHRKIFQTSMYVALLLQFRTQTQIQQANKKKSNPLHAHSWLRGLT